MGLRLLVGWVVCDERNGTNDKIATLLFASTLLVVAADRPQTFTGIITDSMCGKDHKAMKISPEDKCVRDCVKYGSKYALNDGKNLYILSDQKRPSNFAAQKVKITGVLDEKEKVLKVDSIQAIK